MVEEFIGYAEGYLVTTDIDSQGDRLTPQVLESFANQLRKKRSLRKVFLSHDIEQPVGYIVDFHVVTKGEWKGLHTQVGIYKTSPNIWVDMESGKLTGFSFGAKLIYEELQKMSNYDCSFSIEVKGEDSHQFRDMLEQMGAQVETYSQKAVDFPTILTVSCSLLSLAGTIYGIYALAKRKPSDPTIKITKTQRKLTFKDHTVEEIVEEIEASLKGKKD